MEEKYKNNDFILELFESHLSTLNISSRKYENINNKINEKSIAIKKYLSSSKALDTFNYLTILFRIAEGEISNLFFCEGFRLGMRLASERSPDMNNE